MVLWWTGRYEICGSCYSGQEEMRFVDRVIVDRKR